MASPLEFAELVKSLEPPQCEHPEDCGILCYCGDYVEGHGDGDGSHMAVPMQCDMCDPPVKCETCGVLVTRAYAHVHKCPVPAVTL